MAPKIQVLKFNHLCDNIGPFIINAINDLIKDSRKMLTLQEHCLSTLKGTVTRHHLGIRKGQTWSANLSLASDTVKAKQRCVHGLFPLLSFHLIGGTLGSGSWLEEVGH